MLGMVTRRVIKAWVGAFVQTQTTHFRRLLHRIMHRFLEMVFRGREIVTAGHLWRVANPVTNHLNRVFICQFSLS